MTEKIAAYHEAGHAVCAVASRYHNLVYPISVAGAGAFGEAPVALSRSKVQAGGKPTEVAAAVADPDISADAAVVFLAGYAAEARYCRSVAGAGEAAELDRGPSNNDYRMAADALARAGVENTFHDLEAAATVRVEELWPVVSEFANELHRRRAFDPVDAIDFIRGRLGR